MTGNPLNTLKLTACVFCSSPKIIEVKCGVYVCMESKCGGIAELEISNSSRCVYPGCGEETTNLCICCKRPMHIGCQRMAGTHHNGHEFLTLLSDEELPLLFDEIQL